MCNFGTCKRKKCLRIFNKFVDCDLDNHIDTKNNNYFLLDCNVAGWQEQCVQSCQVPTERRLRLCPQASPTETAEPLLSTSPQEHQEHQGEEYNGYQGIGDKQYQGIGHMEYQGKGHKEYQGTRHKEYQGTYV